MPDKKWTTVRVKPSLLDMLDAINEQREKLGLPKLAKGTLIQTLAYEEIQRLAVKLNDKVT